MRDLKDITAAILAGGLGTRLRKAVSDRPKVLAEVRGKPFLTYLLDMLASFGISRVVLCTGYLGERVKEVFGDRYSGIRLVYSRESEPLGTAGALRYALPHFDSDMILALNGDSYCHADLSAFGKFHLKHGAEASLLLIEKPDPGRYGSVLLDEGGRILQFREKHARAGTCWISAGIYLINRKMLYTIPEGMPVSIERDTFPSWIGGEFFGYKGRGDFIDIGTPESLIAAGHFTPLEAIDESS